MHRNIFYIPILAMCTLEDTIHCMHLMHLWFTLQVQGIQTEKESAPVHNGQIISSNSEFKYIWTNWISQGEITCQHPNQRWYVDQLQDCKKKCVMRIFCRLKTKGQSLKKCMSKKTIFNQQPESTIFSHYKYMTPEKEAKGIWE